MQKRQGPIKVKCDECQSEFGTWPFILAARKNKFCSRVCMGKWNSKHKIFPKLNPEQKAVFREGHNRWRATKARTPEHLKKMSEAAKKAGCKPPSRKGTKSTIETRKKQSLALLGRSRGGKHRSDAAIMVRLSSKNKEWRQRVFIRDNFTCQDCGAKSGNGKTVILSAHHKTIFSVLLTEAHNYMPLLSLYDAAMQYSPLWDISNGITLCTKCHSKTFLGRPGRNRKVI